MNKNGFVGAVIAGFIVIVGLIVGFTGIKRVPTGHRGVIYSYRNGVTGETVGEGLRFVGPMKELVCYSVGIEQSYLTKTKNGDSPNDDSFQVSSSDGKALSVELTFTYRYDEQKIAQIFKQFRGRNGNEVRDTFIRPNIVSWVKEVTARYPVTEILGEKRADLNSDVSAYVHNKFEPYGIIVENVSLIDISTDEETRAAIQKKVTAQQNLELSRIEKQTAEVNAEKEKEVALIKANQDKETAAIEAEQKVIKANAEAEATRIKAQAQAEANKAIAESLTPELIQKTFIDKWLGEVPKFVSGDCGSLPILNIQENLK